MVLRKVIVTGSNGQLGCELKAVSPQYQQFDFVFFSREDFPINNKEISDRIFEEHKPAFLINCAAYTAVDKAESEPDTANDINGKAVGHLAFLCNKYETRMIHISTDYVFNGRSKRPLREDDATDPINAYGASKLLGEYLAMKNDPDCIIFRTSWLYSSFGKNFVKTMLRLMKEKESINVVNDQIGSPTYAADLAEAILYVIHSELWVPGLYHFSNKGSISWFEFAAEICDLTKSNCVVNGIPTTQYPTPAERPRYSVMDTSKFSSMFGLEVKNWKDSLTHCLKKII